MKKAYVDTQGYHYIFELSAKDKNLLYKTEELLAILKKILEEIGATIVSTSYKEFGPGASGVFLLAESHLSFHTWPEENYVSIDFYICGTKAEHKLFPIKISEYFDIHDLRVFRRGVKALKLFRIEPEL